MMQPAERLLRILFPIALKFILAALAATYFRPLLVSMSGGHQCRPKNREEVFKVKHFSGRLRLHKFPLAGVCIVLLFLSSLGTHSAFAASPPSRQLPHVALHSRRGVHPASIGVGSGPIAEAVGDFNGDSHLDLAVANSNDNTVGVLLGRGDGTFAPQVTYPVGNSPQFVAVGDFNGDGHLDLAVANFSDDTVSVLLGNGDGTFAPQVTYPVGYGPIAIAVGDFNGDGHLDLAVANYVDATVSVLLGNGDGTFAPQVTYPVGINPSSIAVGDFNGDGHLDLVTANNNGYNPNGNGNTVSVLLGNGDGTFAPQVTYSVGRRPNAIAVGDFNGDGHLDLAVANLDDTTVSVLMGNGDGTFAPQVTYPVGNSPSSIAVGDFNGDGHPDLAVANASDNTVSVLMDNGDGTFAPQVTYPVGNTPLYVTVGDFNGDGHPNLTTANFGDNTVSVLLNNGNGTFSSNTLQVNGQNISASEGLAFSGDVANGTYSGSGTLSATINWGDGSPTTSGTITGTSSFTVSGTHTYAEEGNYTISIFVSDDNGHTANTTSPATVSDAALSLTHFVTGPVKHLYAGVAATFTDADPNGQVSDYTATVNWGDGNTSNVRVFKNPLGKGFVLADLHHYASKGTYSVTLNISDSGGSQVTKTVRVTIK